MYEAVVVKDPLEGLGCWEIAIDDMIIERPNVLEEPDNTLDDDAEATSWALLALALIDIAPIVDFK